MDLRRRGRDVDYRVAKTHFTHQCKLALAGQVAVYANPSTSACNEPQFSVCGQCIDRVVVGRLHFLDRADLLDGVVPHHRLQKSDFTLDGT